MFYYFVSCMEINKVIYDTTSVSVYKSYAYTYVTNFITLI